MWFTATLLLKCIVDEQATGPWTVQENIRLIEAEDEAGAHEKALALGQRAEHAYLNASGERVRWAFLGLGDLEWIDQDVIADGAEIRTRFLERDDPKALVTEKSELVVFKKPVGGA